MSLSVRQTQAFVMRDLFLTKRYLSWVVVFTFYSIVNSAAIALIGVAAGDARLTMTLVVGALLWSFLSALFTEISNSITYERWEGTLEYTFMAPVRRSTHMIGTTAFSFVYGLVHTAVILTVALVVAVMLTLRRRPGTKHQDPARQVAVRRDDRVRLVKMPAESRQEGNP